MNPTLGLQAFLFAVCVSTSSFAQQSSIHITTTANGSLESGAVGYFGKIDQVNGATDGFGEANADGFLHDFDLSASAVATAKVVGGEIHATAHASTAGPSSASAATDVSVLDYVTLRAPGESGVGILKIRLYYQLALTEVFSPSSLSFGGATLTVRFGEALISRQADLVKGFSNWRIDGGGESFEDILISTRFTFGQPIYYLTQLRLGASTRGSATMLVDAGKSLYWAGIESVTVNGRELTEFTAVGAAGVDYARSYLPVPEPASWALLLVGLTGVIIRCSVSRRLTSAARGMCC